MMVIINSIFIVWIFVVTFIDDYYNVVTTKILLYGSLFSVIYFYSLIFQNERKGLYVNKKYFLVLLLYCVLLTLMSFLSKKGINVQELLQLFFVPVLYLFLSNISIRQVRFLFWSIISAKALFCLLKAINLIHVDALYLPGLVLVLVAFGDKFFFRSTSNLYNIKFYIFVVLGLLIVFFFGPRGDVISFIAVILYVFLYHIKIVRFFSFILPVVIALTIGIVSYMSFPSSFPQAVLEGDKWTIAQRINLWGTSVKIAVDNFPIGLGYKQFNNEYRDYWLDRPELEPFEFDLVNVESPHNQVMLTLAEGGGLLLVLLLLMFRGINVFSKDRGVRLGQFIIVSYWCSLGTDWFYGSAQIIVIFCLIFISKAKREIGDGNEDRPYY